MIVIHATVTSNNYALFMERPGNRENAVGAWRASALGDVLGGLLTPGCCAQPNIAARLLVRGRCLPLPRRILGHSVREACAAG